MGLDSDAHWLGSAFNRDLRRVAAAGRMSHSCRMMRVGSLAAWVTTTVEAGDAMDINEDLYSDIEVEVLDEDGVSRSH